MVWLYILIGIVIGVAAGMLAAAIIFRRKEVGTLQVTFAEKDEAPLLFCELQRDIDTIIKRKWVVLRVKEQWFFIRNR